MTLRSFLQLFTTWLLTIYVGIFGVCMKTLAFDVPPTGRVLQELSLPPAQARHAFTDEERDCLARTVYGEAANQPLEGKVAVAAVLVTRSLKGAWPSDLCAVARQPAQFGGYREQVRLGNFLDRNAYHEAQVAALLAAERYGALPAQLRRATFFHEGKARKRWQGQPMIAKIGDHVFYGGET